MHGMLKFKSSLLLNRTTYLRVPFFVLMTKCVQCNVTMYNLFIEKKDYYKNKTNRLLNKIAIIQSISRFTPLGGSIGR